MDILSVVIQTVVQYALAIIAYLAIGAGYSIWWFWAMNKTVSRVYARKKQQFTAQGKTENDAKKLAMRATLLFSKFWFRQKTLPIVASECYGRLFGIIFVWPFHAVKQIVGVNFLFVIKKTLHYLARWFKWTALIYRGVLWLRRTIMAIYGVEAVASKVAEEVSADFSAITKLS